MNYYEAVEYIESLSPTQVKPGLERIRLFMREKGDPQDLIPALHVGGTNGKGSVTAILAEALKQSGLKTGRYTGPHILDMTERIELDGHSISKDEFAAIMGELKSQSEAFALRHLAEGKLSWFELITAIAFYAFSKSGLEATVYEVGLGGQFDATNILCSPVCTCITNVSLDHTHILGNTVEEIAGEKAGIIKPGVPLVTGAEASARRIITERAGILGAPVICINEDLSLEAGGDCAEERLLIDALQERFLKMRVPLKQLLEKEQGYQRINAALAAAVLGIWEIKTGKTCLDAFEEALKNYFWPGRLQFFESERILLDGAHNTAGALALRRSLDTIFPGQRRCFILSFYRSKQFKEILESLLHPGDLVLCSAQEGKRSVVTPAEIAEQAKSLGAEARIFDTLAESFEISKELSLSGACLRIGTGSFATVAAGLQFLGFATVEESRASSRRIRA